MEDEIEEGNAQETDKQTDAGRLMATDKYPTKEQQGLLIMTEERPVTTMDYRAAIMGPAEQLQGLGTSYRRWGPEYIEITTFKVKPIDGDYRNMAQVLDQIDIMGLDDMGNVTGIQESNKRLSKYKVTFYSNDSKRSAWETWRLEAGKGTVKMVPGGGGGGGEIG